MHKGVLGTAILLAMMPIFASGVEGIVLGEYDPPHSIDAAVPEQLAEPRAAQAPMGMEHAESVYHSEPIRLAVEPNQSILEDRDEDAIESGSSELEIHFFDAQSNAAVSGKVQLWRLNAPGNRNWTHGDQLQIEADYRGNKLVINKLPEGRYRAFPLFAQADSEAPFAFRVRGKRTIVNLPAQMPQERESFIKLFNADGTVLVGDDKEQIEVRRQSRSYSTGLNFQPAWVNSRQKKNTGGTFRSRGWRGGGSSNCGASWKKVQIGADGIGIGKLIGNSYEIPYRHGRSLRLESGSTISISISPTGTGKYVALVVDPFQLQELLVFPKGDPILDFKYAFRVDAIALPVGGETGRTSEYGWLNASVRIRLTTNQYRKIDFVWSPSNGSLPLIKLKAIDFGPSKAGPYSHF